MNLAIQAFQQFKDKNMTAEQAFIAGWQAALTFQKANSQKPTEIERSVTVSATPLGRFADGAG